MLPDEGGTGSHGARPGGAPSWMLCTIDDIRTPRCLSDSTAETPPIPDFSASSTTTSPCLLDHPDGSLTVFGPSHHDHVAPEFQ